MAKPVIGITVDNQGNTAASGRYECATAYTRCIAEAGGAPVLLPHETGLVEQFVQTCDGLILTGGVDPRTEPFGQPTHPQARPMDPQRQAFELALLEAADRYPDKPVLGVCLGMQLMALRAGALLDQYLPDTLENAELHQKDNRHGIAVCVEKTALREPVSPLIAYVPCEIVSAHRQAVLADAGSRSVNAPQGTAGGLRVVATATDGVVEAIDDPSRRFYLGVQWHPERGGGGVFNQGLFDRLVSACRYATSPPASAPHR